MEVFEHVPAWEAESMNYYAARGAAFLSIVSDDPEAMKGVDHAKMAAAHRFRRRGILPLLYAYG